MNSLHQELQENYGIQFHGDVFTRQLNTIRQVLHAHRYSFSHFITMHPKRLIDIGDSLKARDALMQAIPGRYRNTNARFVVFHSVSKAAQRTVQPMRQIEFWRREYLHTEWDCNLDDTQLLAPWHIHALIGSVRPTEKTEELTHKIHWHSMKMWSAHYDVRVKEYDHSEHLINYLTDARRGNYIPGLQDTNDEYIRSQLAKRGVSIRWCPPHRNKEKENANTN